MLAITNYFILFYLTPYVMPTCAPPLGCPCPCSQRTIIIITTPLVALSMHVQYASPDRLSFNLSMSCELSHGK